jgi:hypothetical protein
MAKPLNPGLAMELNFVINKFKKLTPATRYVIYRTLRCGAKTTAFYAAGVMLLELIKDANPDELTGFARKELHAQIDLYVIRLRDFKPKALFFARYFRGHLRRIEGQCHIRSIDMKALL